MNIVTRILNQCIMKQVRDNLIFTDKHGRTQLTLTPHGEPFNTAVLLNMPDKTCKLYYLKTTHSLLGLNEDDLISALDEQLHKHDIDVINAGYACGQSLYVCTVEGTVQIPV